MAKENEKTTPEKKKPAKETAVSNDKKSNKTADSKSSMAYKENSGNKYFCCCWSYSNVSCPCRTS